MVTLSSNNAAATVPTPATTPLLQVDRLALHQAAEREDVLSRQPVGIAEDGDVLEGG